MALSKAGLKSRIETELTAQSFVHGGVYSLWLQRFATALANAIVDEITANARCSGNDSNGDSHGNVQIV